MAADVAEQVPRDHHASLSQSSVLDATEPPPDEPTPLKAGDSAPVTIQVEPDVQGIPETESITMVAPLRSSIDISMEEARNRGVSASLTERTRTSSKNLFVKQESMTQLSTTVSTTTTDTATGSSDVFPEMTATNSADTPTTPPSDSDNAAPSYPDPKTKKKPISKQETTTTRQSGTRPSVLAQTPPQQRSPDFVQREVYRKYRNQIRRTRKNHIIIVSLVVYLGLALFGAAIAFALASVALQKFHAPLYMPAILFGIIVVDCVLALVGELSLFVRMCYRIRNQADINPQLYFLFQLSRRPIVMGSLSVVWWFHVQDKSNAGTWSFGGRFAYGTMIFLSMWEVFVIYMQWDEHGLAVILRTYDKLRAIFCCASIEDRDVSDEPKPEEHHGFDYQEFDTVSDFSPRSVPITSFDYQYTDQSVSRPESKEPEPSPTPPKNKMSMPRSRSIPSQSFEVVTNESSHRSKRKERRNNLDPKDFRRGSKKEKQSVRKKINESGQIQIVKTGTKYLDEDYGQMEMSVSLSSRSETNRRVGKWKPPKRRKKPGEEVEETGPWKTQGQADRERKKRHSESERRGERRDRPRRRRHDEDELHYRKKENPRGNQVIVIAGGKKGSSRSKSPRRR